MLTPEELTAQRALHKTIRSAMSVAMAHGSIKSKPDSLGLRHWINHRQMLLLWGYVRGFKFRRIERTHRKQVLEDGSIFEHNVPKATILAQAFSSFIVADVAAIQRWLHDPTGAIPAPPPRPKKPYASRPEAAE